MPDNEQPKLTFPITGAEACPSCGSIARIGQQYLNELEASGKLPKDSAQHGMMLQIPIMAALAGTIVAYKPEIPVIVITFDVCASCFNIYATRINVVKQPVQMKPGFPPGASPPGGFPPMRGS